MPGLVLRLGIVALVALALWAIISIVRGVIANQRALAFAAGAEPAPLPANLTATTSPVRILAFSSETCRPCHTLQRPALEQIAATHGDTVVIDWIDAPSSPELTGRYHVLTVPTTVVLDAHNRVQAVNYGFAPTKKLREQIEAAVAQAHVSAKR
jgi:thioredoxin 1